MTATTAMTQDQLLAFVAKLQADNTRLAAAALAASAPKALTCKVSEKGALSIYGLGRFPVTLYRGQWERLFAATAQVEAFIAANSDLLATKPTP